METEFRFILLDFGHPMSDNTMKRVINSLEDVLALSLILPRGAEEKYFGISFLNSDFTVLQSERYVRENYNLLKDNLQALLKKVNVNNKVTVPKYKYFLSSSIDLILQVSQQKFNGEQFCRQSKSLQVKVAVVTKKTASILIDILTDVTKKLFENLSTESPKQEYTVLQILCEQEERTSGSSDENPQFKWMSCSDSKHDLSCFFKDWYLNRPQALQILLSKDLNFVLKCEMEDFMVNPISVSFDGKFDILNSLSCRASTGNSSLGISKPVHNLEIVNRIPVQGLCSTLVYGIPRCIRSARFGSSWVEAQMNLKMFKELCRELDRTKQGLLTKSVSSTARSKLITFHFLTSDGFVLLLNDVVPDELYLPKHMELGKPDSGDDESAASFVKSCVQKIPFLEEYSPENFTSGFYEFLRNRFKQAEHSKSFSKSFDSDTKPSAKRTVQTKSPTSKSKSKDEKFGQPNKRAKLNQEKEFQNTHPALLSSKVVEKYRKVPSDVFNLLELGEDFCDSVV